MSKSPVSALVLVGVAALVAAFAWMMSTDAPIESEARVVDLPEVSTGPTVMALTPHERRLQGRLEGAQREIEEYKKQGKVLENGAIVVPDVDGSPLYIHPKLIEGKGRYGEPLYATAKYKRRAAMPLRELKTNIPDKAKPKLADARGKLKLGFEKKPGSENDRAGGAGADDGSGSGSGNGTKGGKGGGGKPGKGKGNGGG